MEAMVRGLNHYLDNERNRANARLGATVEANADRGTGAEPEELATAGV